MKTHELKAKIAESEKWLSENLFSDGKAICESMLEDLKEKLRLKKALNRRRRKCRKLNQLLDAGIAWLGLHPGFRTDEIVAINTRTAHRISILELEIKSLRKDIHERAT